MSKGAPEKLADLFPLRFSVLGRPCSFKNSKQVVSFGGKPTIVPSRSSAKWLDRAVKQLGCQWRYKPIPKSIALNAAIVSYYPTKGPPDADNLLGGPGDALQAAGILEDDVSIAAHDGSRRRYDKKRPRVEITLTLFEDDGTDAIPWVSDEFEF